jgi:hypothetical protein
MPNPVSRRRGLRLLGHVDDSPHPFRRDLSVAIANDLGKDRDR